MEQSIVTLLLLAVTVFISYKGFNNPHFVDRYSFDVNKVMVQKEYVRFISSGFLHTGWRHLLFNGFALFAFGTLLEPIIGSGKFLLLYFISMLGSHLLALFIHRGHSGYSAVGASGAINGIVFATIALFPNMGMGLFLLPLSIPAWAFGLAYVVFTLYGIKAGWGNSGHAAHLGGALIGMVVAVAIYPQVIADNYLPILLIALPAIAFLWLLVYKPHTLVIGAAPKKRRYASIDHEYNHRKAQEQSDIDAILEKIHRSGIKSLTRKERETLETYSKVSR